MCSSSILFPVPLDKGNMGYKDSGFQEKKTTSTLLSACHFSHFPLVWFFLHFTPSMCFALSLQSAFYTQSACYP